MNNEVTYDHLAMGCLLVVWALQDVKANLQLPSRLGWNGDPCVPPVHPWNGVTCAFDPAAGGWFVSAV
jgi:hypothetical protein